MAESSELCPTCHSFVSSNPGPGGGRVQGEEDPGKTVEIIDPTGETKEVRTSTSGAKPQWTDDPVLTLLGFNGPSFIDSQRGRFVQIQELQNARIAEEEEVGLAEEERTDFSNLDDDTHIRNTHIIELRESTEKILNVTGIDLKEYFSLDIDGEEQTAGPNDEQDKEEWTDVERGKSYLAKDGTEKTTFLLPDGTPESSPSLPDSTHVRAIHLEDLRRPLEVGWREFWSVTPTKTFLTNGNLEFETQAGSSEREQKPVVLTGGIIFDPGPMIIGGSIRTGSIEILNNQDVHPSDGGFPEEFYDFDRTWYLTAFDVEEKSSFIRNLFYFRESFGPIIIIPAVFDIFGNIISEEGEEQTIDADSLGPITVTLSANSKLNVAIKKAPQIITDIRENANLLAVKITSSAGVSGFREAISALSTTFRIFRLDPILFLTGQRDSIPLGINIRPIMQVGHVWQNNTNFSTVFGGESFPILAIDEKGQRRIKINKNTSFKFFTSMKDLDGRSDTAPIFTQDELETRQLSVERELRSTASRISSSSVEANLALYIFPNILASINFIYENREFDDPEDFKIGGFSAELTDSEETFISVDIFIKRPRSLTEISININDLLTKMFEASRSSSFLIRKGGSVIAQPIDVFTPHGDELGTQVEFHAVVWTMEIFTIAFQGGSISNSLDFELGGIRIENKA